MAAIAGLIVTASGAPTVAAETATVSKSIAASAASHDVTDFSAARRHRYYRRGPSAAGLAFMGMATGLIAGAIAEQRRREYYENYYYYGPRPYYGPGYYGGGPYYYGGPRYYYPRY
jgi:hypothetical protein